MAGPGPAASAAPLTQVPVNGRCGAQAARSEPCPPPGRGGEASQKPGFCRLGDEVPQSLSGCPPAARSRCGPNCCRAAARVSRGPLRWVVSGAWRARAGGGTEPPGGSQGAFAAGLGTGRAKLEPLVAQPPPRVALLCSGSAGGD